jgi:YVTN family beta-propeller protein
MSGSLPPVGRPRRRRSRRNVSPVLVVGVAVGLVVIAGIVVRALRGGHPAGPRAPVATTTVPVVSARRRLRRLVLVERTTGSLAAPVQDEAAAPVGAGAMLLGGLTSADTSRADIRIATAKGDRSAGVLPVALHDTAAVRLGRSIYLFGGGTNAGTQSDAIVRVGLQGGSGAVVGRLPAPSSDQSAAAIGGTAYVVGGYTGSQWLDTIVAWRPGTRPRVVAHLPSALRYAAVTAADGWLLIAGGSLENGTASDAVLGYRPGSKGPVRLGRLPAPTTHAAAATLGPIAYVIGGRGSILDTPTARIVAIDPRTRRIRPAGTLASARSDLAATGVGDGILLAGGRGAAGAEAGLSLLRRRSVAVPRAAARRRTTFAVTAGSVYAHDGANMLTGAARFAKQLVYVPNSGSDTVDVIDPHTYRIVDQFAVGGLPQHVVPAWDLRTLYVTNDTGNSLTPIDPRTGKPGVPIPVDDPYNMYFTPDGRYAIVVAERLGRLDFRDAHSFRLHHSLDVPCKGVDHMDFSANGRVLLASCEFSGQMIVVDVAHERVLHTIDLPDGPSGMPQDVKLSPDGRIFYVADMHANGLWEIDAHSYRVLRFLPTGAGAHGLYPSRNGKLLYATNRSAGTISVISFRTRRIVATWDIPGGSPDMGGVSADGSVLWLSGRYNSEVYAISTRTGKLLARIPVGAGPHGLCVWPQPGRYSLGHTGILR